MNLMRSALVPRVVETVAVSPVLSIGYDHNGALLYVNEGFQGRGFNICPKCGRHVNKRTGKCDGKLNGQPCPGKLDMTSVYTLGFKQATDTLHLKFSSTAHILLPDADNSSFWLSLKYALLQGASRALQIERKDIDGLLFPEPIPDPTRERWRQSIVLYDNVPGGAGNVKRIQEEITQVIAAALEVIDCDCEKSCYRCLREYGNQWEHHELDRTQVVGFLRALDADLQQSQQGDVNGVYSVAAINQTAWLWEQIERAQQELILFADHVTLDGPKAERVTWLDLLQHLLQKGVNIRLILNHLPDQSGNDAEAIVIARHLQMLLRRGLDLRQTNRQLPWIAVIDPESAASSAVGIEHNTACELGQELDGQLSATNHRQAVMQCWTAMQQYRVRAVEFSELNAPENIRMVEVEPDRARHSEAEFFAEFYAEPVRGMVVSDRYLDNRERILNRLGAHIELAQRGGELEWVVVNAVRTQGEQDDAIRALKEKFPKVKIKFSLDGYVAHDRMIEVTRQTGSRSRVLIGIGLDFITANGFLRETFLVFQNTYTPSQSG